LNRRKKNHNKQKWGRRDRYFKTVGKEKLKKTDETKPFH